MSIKSQTLCQHSVSTKYQPIPRLKYVGGPEVNYAIDLIDVTLHPAFRYHLACDAFSFFGWKKRM